MAEYTVELNRKNAEAVVAVMINFQGGKPFVPHRLKILDAIGNTFTSLKLGQDIEVTPSMIEDEEGLTVKLELDSRKQKALYEGFLSILNSDKKNGADDINIRKVARLVRLWNEVEKALGGDKSAEFDGVPDGDETNLKPDESEKADD